MRGMTPGEWFAARYPSIVVALIVLQHAFVNLIFTTYTQNIVILKDLSAPFFSILILGVWVVGDVFTTGRWFLPKHGVVVPMVANATRDPLTAERLGQVRARLHQNS